MKDSINSNANISSTPMQCVNIGELGITLTTNQEFLSEIMKPIASGQYINNNNENF